MNQEPSFSEITTDIPGFLFVDHIAIAVPQGLLEAQVETYKLMGFREVHREEIGGGDQVREVLLQIGNSPNLFQLVEPMNDASPVQKALDRNGGKAHLTHIGIRVADIGLAFETLKNRGFKMIDAAPRPGSRGTTVFFMHPKGPESAPLNIMIEVVEE